MTLSKRCYVMFRFAAIVFVGSICGVPMGAQSRPDFELAAGVVTPHGTLGSHRDGGPLIRAAVAIGDPRRMVRLRFGGEAAVMRGRHSPDVPQNLTNDLRVLGAMVDVIVRPGIPVGPYVFGGAGLKVLDVANVRGGTSATLGLRGGVGVQAQLKRFRVSLEIAPTAALTSRGAEADVWAVFYQSLTIGIGF